MTTNCWNCAKLAKCQKTYLKTCDNFTKYLDARITIIEIAKLLNVTARQVYRRLAINPRYVINDLAKLNVHVKRVKISERYCFIKV